MCRVADSDSRNISIRAFRIDEKDNVATLLDPAAPGDRLTLLGDTKPSAATSSPAGNEPCPEDAPAPGLTALTALEAIPAGHKIALCDIECGGDIIKYCVVIGRAAAPIRRGHLVHIPLIRSLYDERSGHLDPETGKPKDISYE